jgi:hypothetical protein
MRKPLSVISPRIRLSRLRGYSLQSGPLGCQESPQPGYELIASASLPDKDRAEYRFFKDAGGEGSEAAEILSRPLADIDSTQLEVHPYLQ